MTKKIKKYRFEKILLADGWAEDITLSVGAQGLISAINGGGTGAKVKGVAIPAMLNAHSHAFQRAFAGKTEEKAVEGDDFWAWRQVMYRALTKIGPKEMEAIAAWLYVEMLKSGYAGVAEFHYLHHKASGSAYDDPLEMSDAIINAAKSSGIDLFMLPVLYQRADFGTSEVNEGQRRFNFNLADYEALLKSLKKKCRAGVALHSLRAVPEENLEPAAKMSGGPVHIHIAEQEKEVTSCLEVHGKRPIEWLLDNIDVNHNWHLVHATQINAREFMGILKLGAGVVLCPTTEANLGDGIFPFQDFIENGGPFSIGSDSHVSIDPREELRLLEYGQRLALRRRAIAGQNPGAALWQGAVAGGAHAMGYAKAGLEVGAPAHVAVLDTTSPALYGQEGDGLLDALVFSGQPNPVKDVMVSGQWRVKDFKHVKEDQLKAAFLSVLKAL